MTETDVPIHLPNKIPERIKIGDPNPRHENPNNSKYRKIDYINYEIVAYKLSRLSCNSL